MTVFRSLAVLAALLGGLAVAGVAQARADVHVYCKVKDRGADRKAYYSGVVLSPYADEVSELQEGFLAQVRAKHPISDKSSAYCFYGETRADAEARIKEAAAKDAAGGYPAVFTGITPAPDRSNGPTASDAQAFLKEVLTNGVSRVHPMTAPGEMVSGGYRVKRVDTGRCTTSVVYVGDWFGRPVDEVLEIEWTSAVEVRPFFKDPARSHVAALTAVTQRTAGGGVENRPGVVVDTGSESMEPRVTKAMQTLADACAPKSRHGF